jgi:hypothetical protein
VVSAGAGRVDVLAPAQRGPTVDIDKNAGLGPAGGELGIGQLREVSAECGAVSPHVDLAGKPHDHVDARIAALRIDVVTGWQINPERPTVRIAQGVAFQDLTRKDVFVIAALGFEKPWRQIRHDATIGSLPPLLAGGR